MSPSPILFIMQEIHSNLTQPLPDWPLSYTRINAKNLQGPWANLAWKKNPSWHQNGDQHFPDHIRKGTSFPALSLTGCLNSVNPVLTKREIGLWEGQEGRLWKISELHNTCIAADFLPNFSFLLLEHHLVVFNIPKFHKSWNCKKGLQRASKENNKDKSKRH